LLGYLNIQGGFGSIFDHIGQIFRNPKSYAKELVILIAVLFLIFLLILLAVMILLALKRQYLLWKAYNDLNVKPTKKQLARFLLLSLISITGIFALAAAGVSSPPLCGKCHVVKKAYEQWQNSVHKAVSCTGCHFEPGIFGYASGTLRGSENLLAFVFKPPIPLQADITNDTCLNCHQNIKTEAVSGERQISVKHKEIINAGFLCTDCHNSVAHEKTLGKPFTMSLCIKCHNEEKASSKCITCHQKDIAYKPHVTLDDWPKVKNARIICTGCHSAKIDQSCIKCHEVELPHPDKFRKDHARLAEKNKSLCYKCHSKTMATKEMCSCHEDGNTHGNVSKWYVKHRSLARINGVGCNCHSPKYCSRCHDNPDSVYPHRSAGGLQGSMR
jgi:nitrate/TMAO reductase-like tetraheme cytochrome c subunit